VGTVVADDDDTGAPEQLLDRVRRGELDELTTGADADAGLRDLGELLLQGAPHDRPHGIELVDLRRRLAAEGLAILVRMVAAVAVLRLVLGQEAFDLDGQLVHDHGQATLIVREDHEDLLVGAARLVVLGEAQSLGRDRRQAAIELCEERHA